MWKAYYILYNHTHLGVTTNYYSDSKFVGFSLVFCQLMQGWIQCFEQCPIVYCLGWGHVEYLFEGHLKMFIEKIQNKFWKTCSDGFE
jgi:hypothetical protein